MGYLRRPEQADLKRRHDLTIVTRDMAALRWRPVTIPDRGVEAWSSDSWRERATTWLDQQLAEAGAVRTAEVEQTRLRPWATLLRAPTTQGPVWLKATGRDTAFEAGLYELLARVAPERVLIPLAVDVERGWILLPDAGPSLGEQASGQALVEGLATALPQYGQLQRDLAAHTGDLLALGVSDMRPEAMPGRFEEALAAVRGYLERRGDAEDLETYERVAGVRETVVRWCERLAASPVPSSLDHNDLHTYNILLGADGRARFYDWGDAVVAHPFASMGLGLGFVRNQAESGDIERLRDGYLEVFGDLGSHAELVEALELACRVGKVARALTWQRAIGALGWDEVDDDWARGPIESMASVLDASYLGRT